MFEIKLLVPTALKEATSHDDLSVGIVVLQFHMIYEHLFVFRSPSTSNIPSIFALGI